MGLTVQSVHSQAVLPLLLTLDFCKVQCFLFDADWSSPLKVLKLATVLMLPSICLSKYFEKQRPFKFKIVDAGYLVCNTLELCRCIVDANCPNCKYMLCLGFFFVAVA